MEEVIELGGTPREFFQHAELAGLFLPLLRNDFKIAEMEMEIKEIHPLNNNITVFLGKEDDLTAEECDGWKKHTNQLCSIHYFNGGHFFLHDEVEQLLKMVNNTLLSDLFTKSNNLEFVK
jgi:medium-chain acyl-[acyl-carrier-protein] hydrolase